MWWKQLRDQQRPTSLAITKMSLPPVAPSMIMALEPRIMFDAAAVATVADAGHADVGHPDAQEHSSSVFDIAAYSPIVPAAEHASAAPAAERNVLFIDSRVSQADTLLAGISADTLVVYLSRSQDGLTQIADYLAAHQGASSVQIIAHGNAGDLWLGNTYLSADNIATHRDVLAAIGADMADGGDILIYACNTAAGDNGLRFVDSLAQYTGRDVAASSNRTGAGGDWELEISIGKIDSYSVLSYQAMAGYQYGLATITVTSGADSGVGSLRQALNDATAGDTVTFSSAMTVSLNSQLVITKNLTLDGDVNNDGIADVTLDGQYKTQVLRVSEGVTATLDGLVITRGMAVGQGANAGSDASAALGGGIVNAGNLTLNNVTVTGNAASGGGGGGGVRGGTVGGAGGGGGALGGQAGGRGGDAGNGQGYYAGKSGTANTGGNGGGYNLTVMGGRGGSGTGGAGGAGAFGYSNGGGGGTANNGTLSIGGGGGGSGWDSTGRTGAAASGGIYNGTTGTLTIVGNSVISNNVAAGGGGGGGGGSGAGASSDPGGTGGRGVGAIWNKGTLLITAANFSALGSGDNKAASGAGGRGPGGVPANSPASVDGIYNDGGFINTAYNPAPTATIVVSNTTQRIGSTSQVTITFNQAVSGFSLADLAASNGTLSNLATSDNVTWTATFTPNANTSSAGNVITLDNTGVNSALNGTAGSGTTTSNNYSVDTIRPAATITVASATLTTNNTSTVNITFSEAVSGFSLADMSASNGTLSNLSTSDNIHWTATLTPNAGNTSNGNIIILDNSLYTDASGNTGTGVTLSNLYAVDTQRPTATIVVSNTALNIGGSSLVTITFSEAVTGFSLADLTASNGTLSNLTTSDNITWTATLTPTNGVTHSGDVVTLANAGVSDLVGNAGTGTTDSNTYSVDTQRPTATIVFANPNIGIGQTSQVTITFSEAVTGFSNADLTVSNGTLSAVSSSDGGVTWTATFTPTAGISSASNHIILDNTGVADGAGNAGSGTTVSSNYAIDGVRPTATVAIDSSSLRIGETARVTITFSEAVTGFSNADLTVSGGTLGAVTSNDGGITWTATFTPASNITNASNVITLDNTGYTDTAGNAGTGTTTSNNYAIDTQRPTATIVMSDPVLSAGGTSQVTITFSEAVTGFTLGDLNAGHGTLSNLSTSDNIHWTATFTPDANTSSTTNVITLANTGIFDIAGNNGAGTTSSLNYTIDTVRPTATIVVANPALKIGDNSQVTITFSQAVTGFTNADLTVVGGTLSTVTSNDGGITWIATFTPAGNISNAANHITLDNSGVQAVSSGNAGTGISTSNNYVIDTQRPTATIVVANDQLGIGSSSLVTITFSEAVTGFSLADLTADNGTLSNLSTSDNITWTATLTPAAGITQGNNHISLDNTGVTDVAGNAGSGTTDSNAYALDSIRPTATIVIGDATLSAGQSTTVTITFSEPVTGFDNADLSVPNGTLGTLSTSDGGITWTATYTPNTNVRATSNVIALNNGGYSDLSGNAGIGVTNSANFSIDTVRPTATIVVANPTLNVGATSQVTITFSEAVTGFTHDDLTVSGGTLGALTSNDGGITWTATFTPNGNITNASNVITLDNSGVQNASGNAGTGTTTSNNYAIDTQRPTATITVANPNLGIGQTTTVSIVFSEAVTGFSLADLSVANGVLSNLASNDGGKTWTATLTPTAAISDPTNLIVFDTALVSDTAGNAGAGIAISNNYAIDGDRPTATITVANPNLGAGQSTTVTFTFSEKVTGFDLSDLSVTHGALSNLASSDGGRTWTATLTPQAGLNGVAGTVTLNVSGVTDLAGNAGAGGVISSGFIVDSVAPTATIVVGDSALKAGQSTQVTITFSEAVSGFSLADLSVAGGHLDGLISSDGGITWTATFTPEAGLESSGNVIRLDNRGITDAAGNPGVGSTDSNAYAIDTRAPTATIVIADSTLKAGQSTQVTITFSEAVSGFSLADLSVAGGRLDGLISSDGGITWTATFTPEAGLESRGNVIRLDNRGITDAAGNPGVGSTDSNAYAIDTRAPTATIVIADSALKAGQSTQVTITFSEAVSGFSLADLSVAGGRLDGLVSSDGGITWTATFTPEAGLESRGNVIRLDNRGITDAAGNAGIGSTDSNAYAIDTLRPVITQVEVPPAGTYTAGQVLQFVVHFSEDTGFDSAGGTPGLSLQIGNRQVEAHYISGAGTGVFVFQYRVQAGDVAGNGIAVLGLSGAGGLRDGAGNSADASLHALGDTTQVHIDAEPPKVESIVRDTASPGATTVVYTVTFSEAVRNVDAADFALLTTGSVAGKVTTVVQIDSRTYRVEVSDLNGSGSLALVVSHQAGSIVDAAGNALAADFSSLPSSVAIAAPVVIAAPVITFDVDRSVDTEYVLTPAPVVLLGSAGESWQMTMTARGAEPLPSMTAWRPVISLVEVRQRLAEVDSSPRPLAMDRPFAIPVLPGLDAADIQVEAVLANGRPLPAWLSYDPLTGTLKGTPPRGFSGVVEIRLTFTTADGVTVSKVLQLQIGDQQQGHASRPPTAAAPAVESAPVGKPGLQAQFAQHRQDLSLQQLARQLAALPETPRPPAETHS